MMSRVGKSFRGRSASRVFALLSAAFLSGCGEKSAPPAAPTTAPATATSTPVTSPPSTGGENPSQQAVDPARKETKWIGSIPYDVFYDQPLSIATDTTAVPGANATTLAANSTATPAMTPAESSPDSSPKTDSMPAASANAPASPSDAAAGGAVNWGEVLPMPMLIDEVKALRTSLTGNLQTVATFNKSQKPIALDGSIMAAMAAVAISHPENLNWKPNAHFVRDLAFQINENSSGSGREPYTKTKEPFDKITEILDGGKPPEMESPETVPFAEVVYVADMMKRIEITFNNLKANINTEARLKENPAAAEREMRILLTLATLMTDKSYDSADQQGYQDLLKRFNDGARSGVAAIQKGNLEEFQSALNQIQTTCSECHQQYRGSDSGF